MLNGKAVTFYTIPVVLGGVLFSGVGELWYRSHYPVDLKAVTRDVGRQLFEAEYCGTEQRISGTVEEVDPEAKYYFMGDGTAVLKIDYEAGAPRLGESLKVSGTLLCYTEQPGDSIISAIELDETDRTH